LAVWKVPRQCPLVLLVKDLFNFDLKDVGAAVPRERERERERKLGVVRDTAVLEGGVIET
jgi:hypothetical protein